MPPSLREWVPEDHLVRTVLGAVQEMDLGTFYADYRADGHGRPAYEPSMMVALLLYAYARGNRSSRAIERALVEDVAYRLIAANLAPDHSTIADFRVRHEAALAEVFTGVLGLCKRAGLATVGVVAIDGTKVHATRSVPPTAATNRSDARSSGGGSDRPPRGRALGDRRGDELPEQLRTREGRTAALRKAEERLERERRAQGRQRQASSVKAARRLTKATRSSPLSTQSGLSVAGYGRCEWIREGRRALEQQREAKARPILRSRTARLFESARRLEEELAVEHKVNAAYEAWRARGIAADGTRRMAPGSTAPELPEGQVNITDPDSRLMKTFGRFALQGYNAQAAVNENQITVAAEVAVDSPDFGHLEPMVTAAERDSQASARTDHRSSSPTPATGTSARWSRSSRAASRC